LRAVTGILLTMALAGCAVDQPGSEQWHRDGSSQAMLEMDAADCRNQGRLVAGTNAFVSFAQVYTDCMRARGWEYRGKA
jgi:predicted secreted protein